MATRHPSDDEATARAAGAPREGAPRSRETAAAASRACLAEQAVDALASGILVCAGDGEILFASRGAQRLLGRSEASLLGSPVDAFFATTPSLREGVDWLPPGEELRLRTRLAVPGVEREVVVAMAHVEWNGDPSAWVAAFQLAQGDGPVVAANGEWSESLSRVIAGFAHEMRNPLAAIHGLVDLWADGVANPDEHELVTRVRKQIAHLDKLVRAFVAFDLSAAPAIATHALGEILALTRFRLEAAGIPLPQGFVAAERSTSPVIATDPELCADILEELVRNAWEATGSDAYELRAEVSDAADNRPPELAIAVIDHGPGIVPRHRVRIFEPFFTTKRNRPGIGLTVARALARRIGARISVRSLPKVETVFTLILPGVRP